MNTAVTNAYVELGLGVLDERERIDFAGLRAARRERVFEMMDAADLDACIFGRQANIRYVSGARRLWLPETMAFSPLCVAVRATRAVRALSTSASLEGFPEAFQPEDILLNTWNPTKAAGRLAEAPGFAQARRVGVDGMTPGFAELFKSLYPDKTLLPAESLMREARRLKFPAEVLCMRTAAAVAEASLQAVIRNIAPGVSERALQAAYLARMCELGVQTFAQLGAFTAIGPGGALRAITGDGDLSDGVPVVVSGGALWAGYEGSLARTWWCGREAPGPGARAPYRRWAEIMDRLLAACRPGASGAALRMAFLAAGPEPGATFSVDALGLGVEGKIAGSDFDPAVEATQTLDADMVLGVRVFVPGAEGGYLGEDMILIGDGAPERLTTLGSGPLGLEAIAD